MNLFKSSLILLAIFLLLGVYVFFVEYKGSKEKYAERERSEKIYFVKSYDVLALQIKNIEKGTDVLLVQKDGQWMIEKPINKQADFYVVSSMIEGLNTKPEMIVAEGKEVYSNLSKFGLDKPVIIAKIRSKDREEIISVGTLTPVGYNTRYVFVHGSKKIVTSSQIYENFNKTVSEIREKQLFKFDIDSVDKIEIFKNRKSLVIDRRDGEWVYRGVELDDFKVNSLLGDLKLLSVREFVENKAQILHKSGLKNPSVKVILRDNNDKRITSFNFGRVKERDIYLMKNSGEEIYLVLKQIIEKISVDIDKYKKEEEETVD